MHTADFTPRSCYAHIILSKKCGTAFTTNTWSLKITAKPTLAGCKVRYKSGVRSLSVTHLKPYQGRGLAGVRWTQAKPRRICEVPIAHSLPRLGAPCKPISTSYKSMRHSSCAHASDKLQWGREPGLLGRPAIPLGHPHTPPSPVHEFGVAAAGAAPQLCARPWQQPGLRAQGTPAWVGCRRPARPARPRRAWAASRRPPGHLQASAALPCSSPAPKQALGSSGGSGAPPPSRALRFFDIWSVFGS